MPDGTIEILSGKERRRRWSTEEKLRIVAESHEPGACVKAAAARHDVYPGLVSAGRAGAALTPFPCRVGTQSTTDLYRGVRSSRVWRPSWVWRPRLIFTGKSLISVGLPDDLYRDSGKASLLQNQWLDRASPLIFTGQTNS